MRDDDSNSSSERNWRPRKRHYSLKLAISALIIAIAGAAYTYRVGVESVQLQQQIHVQGQTITTISKEVAVLTTQNDKPSFELKSPPGICLCVKKYPGPQVSKMCPAKNEACDDESREICEAQNPDSYC